MTNNPLVLILAFAFHVAALAALIVLLCLGKGDSTLEMGLLSALVGSGAAAGLVAYNPASPPGVGGAAGPVVPAGPVAAAGLVAAAGAAGGPPAA